MLKDLFLEERRQKGPHRRGRLTVLTDEQVRAIRERLAAGESTRTLAEIRGKMHR